MTLGDIQGHSPTASIFKCDVSYICASLDKFSNDLELRAVHLRYRDSFLKSIIVINLETLASSVLKIERPLNDHSSSLAMSPFDRAGLPTYLLP